MGGKNFAENTLINCSDVFADIANVLLFQGKRLITEDSLKTKAVWSTPRDQEGDVVKYWNECEIRFTLTGFDEEPDEDLPILVLDRTGLSYLDQADFPGDERYPVVAMVLNFGKKKWDTNRSLLDCLDVAEILRPYVNDFRINVVDIPWLTDEQVSMFTSDFGVVADYFVQMRRNGKYIPSPRKIRHGEALRKTMAALTRKAV